MAYVSAVRPGNGVARMPPEDAVPRDAIELLAADHDVLRTLASKLSSAAAGDGGVREELLARIDRALQSGSQ